VLSCAGARSCDSAPYKQICHGRLSKLLHSIRFNIAPAAGQCNAQRMLTRKGTSHTVYDNPGRRSSNRKRPRTCPPMHFPILPLARVHGRSSSYEYLMHSPEARSHLAPLQIIACTDNGSSSNSSSSSSSSTAVHTVRTVELTTGSCMQCNKTLWCDMFLLRQPGLQLAAALQENVGST
jgi:hypothetical protein